MMCRTLIARPLAADESVVGPSFSTRTSSTIYDHRRFNMPAPLRGCTTRRRHRRLLGLDAAASVRCQNWTSREQTQIEIIEIRRRHARADQAKT
jgi:hypothetical protein